MNLIPRSQEAPGRDVEPDKIQMFESLEALRDCAARLGVLGKERSEALEALEQMHEGELEHLRAAFEADKGDLEEVVERSEAALEDLGGKREELESLRAQQGNTRQRKEELEAEITRILQDAEARERARGRERWGNKLKALKEELSSYPSSELDEVLGESQKIVEQRKKLASLNEPGNKLRRRELEARARRLDKELTPARERCERLKQQGITKTASGFLLWAGYASFAAVAAAWGVLLQNAVSGGEFLGRAFGGLSGFVRGMSADGGFLSTFGLFVSFLVGGLALLALVTWLSDRLLGSFDRSWPGTRRDKRGGGGGSHLPVLSIPPIQRRSYVQLLATFPFVVAGALLFFFVSWGASQTSSGASDGGMSEVLGGLIGSFVGAAFVLLATSMGILYVTWQICRQESESSDGGLFRPRWELGIILGMMVVAILGAGFLPFLPESLDARRAVWGLIVLFMTASSLALAVGVVTRGIFRDVDILEGDRDASGLDTGALDAQGIVDLDDIYGPGGVLSSLLDRRRLASDLELASLLLFDEDAGASRDRRRLGEIWLCLNRGQMPKGDYKRLRALVRESPPEAGRNRPAELSEEERDRLGELRREQIAVDASLQRLADEVGRQETALEGVDESALMDALEAARGDARRRTQDYSQENSAAIARHHRERLEFEAAFEVGAMFAGRLRPEAAAWQEPRGSEDTAPSSPPTN